MDRAQAAQEDLADREVLENLAGQAALEWEDQVAQALEAPAWAEGLGDHRLHQEAEADADAAVCHL